MLPLFSDWRGTGSPVMNFVSRNGQLMSVSLFDSASNYNCCIAAQSGSGKSFLANEIISSYQAMGGKVWVIDVGRSYLDLCDAYDGDFIEFNKESNICLNPFPLIQDFAEEEDMIIGLVSAMAAPTTPLTDFQVASMKRAFRTIWDEKKQKMRVDDLAAALLEHRDQRVKDVGAQLYPFTRDGEYGKYFDGDNNVNFRRAFSVLELEELKGRQHLQQVVLLQLIYQIQQDMYLGERDRPKVVIIDEAWSLLTEGDVGKFIEHGYRRFRKYGGAAIVITQSVTDLYDSPTGRAIAENSANMYLLGQKPEAIAALEKEERLPINKSGYNLLKTVHTQVGAYSEIFFMTSYGGGIGRLIVDKYHQLLYSTHPKDVQAIKNRRKEGMSIAEAIDSILVERGEA
jgi:conjugal transfer ATP-binding protein TraC